MKQIPKLDGQIFIDGKEYEVCIRPTLNESRWGWSISNFRENIEEILYTEGGPHIRLFPSGLKFVELIKFGETIELGEPGIGCGQMDMLTGRAACDLPYERRNFEKITLRVTRFEKNTKFEFEATAGECLDKQNLPDRVTVNFWFDVPDRFIELFISDIATREVFVKKLWQFEDANMG